MFGRTDFNRGPFNRIENAGDFVWSSIVNAVASASGVLRLTIYEVTKAQGIATAKASLTGTFSTEGRADAVATATADYIRKRFLSSKAEAIATGTAGTLYILGNEFLILEGLDLEIGDELEIDTERMTLMINNQNAIYALSDDSTFFNLNAGDLVAIEGSGTATVTFLWKDRWLG